MLEIEEKKAGKIKRLTNKTFKFDQRLGEGFFTANYFLKTRKIVLENVPHQTVTMQFFQREDDVMLCGIDEAIALIQEFAECPEKLQIEALNDGDIINYGEPVLAVKDGTVVISEAKSGSIKNYDSNGKVIGSYSSYGEYIIINHHDGTMTLYAHGKPGSRLVKAGDEVKQGQQIMSVGNTGNVLPRPTASNYKGGAHLHFEVRINGSTRVNPAPYLP